MSTKEQVLQRINELDESELEQVARFLAFLKFQARTLEVPVPDEARMAELYGECAEEDRAMAEEGMADYAAGLRKEDGR